jgi:hypothetical protein
VHWPKAAVHPPIPLQPIPTSWVSLLGPCGTCQLSTTASDTSTLHAGDIVTARTWLKDGDSPRPKVTLLNKSIQSGPSPSAIQLGDQDELPQEGKLSFFLKTEVPDRFSRTQKIEVATTDGSYNISLSLDDGSLLAQDAHTVMATLDPLKSFGPSAFGPLRFRAVDGEVDKHTHAPSMRCPAQQGKRASGLWV